MTDFVAHYLDASALETSGRQSGRGKGPRCAQEILLRTINLRSSNEFWIGAATRTIFLTLRRMEASNLLQIGRFGICAHDFPPAFEDADATRRPFIFCRRT